MQSLEHYLEQILKRDASDLYLTAESPPVYRVEGVTTPSDESPLSPEDTRILAEAILTDSQRREFAERKEMNVALSHQGRGRFRCNVFQQRGAIGLVIRQIRLDVPSLEALQLPPIIARITDSSPGLVLVTGGTGSGKSTTLAAMIRHRSQTQRGHVVTIEDPIEFVHPHQQSIVTQREVGFDTLSFHEALRNSLRQAPDVILIGEVRDTETMEAALSFAETGHLCLATLHSNNANQAIERVLSFFPQAQYDQVYLQLSLNLQAILSQRLIPGRDGRRVPAVEILLDTPHARDLIRKGLTDELKEAMERGTQEGCQTFDEALFQLYLEGKIDSEQALANADSANNLRIRIRNEELKSGQSPVNGPAFRIRETR